MAPEVCDDGNKLDGIGCSSDCLSVLPTWTCSGGNSTSNDVCLPKHGDGIITGNEQCDDNNTNNNDGCSSVGLIE